MKWVSFSEMKEFFFFKKNQVWLIPIASKQKFDNCLNLIALLDSTDLLLGKERCFSDSVCNNVI